MTRKLIKDKDSEMTTLLTAVEEALVNPVNTHVDQLIDAQVMHSVRAQSADVFRCYVVNAHGH
jgi:hypothetical protein